MAGGRILYLGCICVRAGGVFYRHGAEGNSVSLLCFASISKESRCKACGQLAVPKAHFTKSNGRSEVYCERCCPVCRKPDIQFADTQLPEAEKPRLSSQCRQILERLQQGVASNVDLSNIALKYTSRISDLRKSGFRIEVKERNHETGVVTYELL